MEYTKTNLFTTNIKKTYGVNPFLDGEHQTSWPKRNLSKFLK